MAGEESVRPAKRCLLRLLTYNIQVGFATHSYREYVTGSWRHAFGHSGTRRNIAAIGRALRDYDVVALQEADAGSLRTAGMNLVTEMAATGGFAHSHCLVNRNMGRFAQHAQGLLSRFGPLDIATYRLPGVVAGRNVLRAQIGGKDGLMVVCTHLSLSARTRARQLSFIADLIGDHEHVVLMGDTNCEARELRDSALQQTSLQLEAASPPTYPGWRPRRSLDHVLVSQTMTVRRRYTPAMNWSDHLPLAVDVELPDALYRAIQTR